MLSADLPSRQSDREEPVWGPALKVAQDKAGAWTPAAQGFAKKNGVAVTELLQRAKDDAKPGELNLLFVRKVAGRPTRELVPSLLAGVLRALAFPKRMSWDAWLEDGRGAFPFGRPIRWLVVLFDGTLVPFRVHALEGGARGAVLVESRAETRGHRFLPKGLGQQRLAVSSFAELRERLRERFVIVEPDERAARIEQGLSVAAAEGSFDDHGLREEWRDLVEYPTVVVGQVPQEFQELPPEVLETVLVHHQKYIALRDGVGRIDRFAAVTNGDGAAAPAITRGMQRVVVARLRDAAFFLAEDRKRPLGERLADLAGVTFHRGLGTYRDKAARMLRLVEQMGAQGLLSGDALAAAKKAAELAKGDLVTLMVREFPELQGVMGGIYLVRRGGERDGRERRALALPPDRRRARRGAGGGVRRQGRRLARARRRGSRRQAGHARGLLRHRREPHGQPRPLWPAARRPGRGARRAATSGARSPARRPRTSPRSPLPRLPAIRLSRSRPPRRRAASRRSCSTASSPCSRPGATRRTKWPPWCTRRICPLSPTPRWPSAGPRRSSA